MAVYKPTYCKPFSNTMDIRLGIKNNNESDYPVEFFSCLIDSSNKNVTGYKIRILNNENQQLFPCNNQNGRISPISELQEVNNKISFPLDEKTNSGFNGTSLLIPFFQNKYRQIINSRNAIYYRIKYQVDYIIGDQSTCDQLDQPASMAKKSQGSNIDNWENVTFDEISDSSKCLQYKYSYLDQMPIVDEEAIQPGDTVLLAVGNNKGIWQAEINRQQLILRKIDYSLENGDLCIVKKGRDFQNTIWKSDINVYNRYLGKDFWEDYDGNICPGILNSEQKLKWEITLYQGDPENDLERSVKYDHLDNEWFDMLVASGSILGTTPHRVQIAGVFRDEQGKEEEIIPQSENGDLILQERYMRVFNERDSSNVESNRLIVQNYDASLGHVYLYQKDQNLSLLDNADRCQFFKCSNNEEDLRKQDIISICIGKNINFSYYISKGKGTEWQKCVSENDENWKKASVLDRRLVVEELDIPSGKNILYKYGAQNGSTILLVGQDFGKQNGLYDFSIIQHSVEDIDENGNKTSRTVAYHCLRRSPTYTSWSSYIGRIFYVKSGFDQYDAPWGHFNIESLAPAGNYTLWNPLDIKSGNSSLLFVKERPILLFGGGSLKNTTVDLFESSKAYSATLSGGVEIDSQDVQVGNIILFSDGVYAKVLSFNYGDAIIRLGKPMGTLISGQYFYTRLGATFANTVHRWGTDEADKPRWTRDDNFFTARILRNTKTRTYISYTKNLEKGMRLKIKNNHTVNIDGKETSWINIKEVGKTTGYIDHESLSEPLRSYDVFDDTYPWHYNIYTFNKTSNENPFSTYETPYVTFYKNGKPFSFLEKNELSQQLLVRSNPDFEIYSQALGDVFVDFYVKWYVVNSNFSGNSLQLNAKYHQSQDSSWESYRWILFDSTQDSLGQKHPGKILQDTGFKYSQDINVDFRGLQHELNSEKTYFVLFSIRDTNHNTLVYILNFTSSLDGGGKPTGIFPVTGLKGPGTAYLVIEDLGQGVYVFNGDGSINVYFDKIQAPKDSQYCMTMKYLGGDFAFKNWEKGVGIALNDNFFFKNATTKEDIYPGATSSIDFSSADNFWLHREASFANNFKVQLFYSKKEEDQITFTAQADCKKQAVLLTYDDKRPSNASQRKYSYYRREYEVYEHPSTSTQKNKVFKGEWEPVLLDTRLTSLYDYNIKNHRSYQYIVYTQDEGSLTVSQVYANYTKEIWIELPDDNGYFRMGGTDTMAQTGAPVFVNWTYWSIAELIPEKNNVNVPIVRQQFKVNEHQKWYFKYGFEGGSQSQITDKTPYETMGQFPRYGFGKQNYLKGSVSAYLGSELVLGESVKYIERLPESRVVPTSTNEPVSMLDQWRLFVFSKNPKILKDNKGQSWIVQISNGQNSPQDFWTKQPDKISFEWTQVSTTQNMCIYSLKDDTQEKVESYYGNSPWVPHFKKYK